MSKLYTDFDLSMSLSATGDVISLTDEDCIRQTIKNSVSMNSFDIPFNNYHAANIKKYLFESQNKVIEAEMRSSIIDVLLLDPRLVDPEVKFTYSNDGQYCYVDVKVYVVILNSSISETIKVSRVR